MAGDWKRAGGQSTRVMSAGWLSQQYIRPTFALEGTYMIDVLGLNIGLFKEIRQTIIQIKREHQQAYSL